MFFILHVIFSICDKKMREYLRKDKISSSLELDEFKRIDCENEKIYCIEDNDCLHLCTRNLNLYKCNNFNICSQYISKHELDNISKIDCNKKFGFYPVLKVDEFLQPIWFCLNTRPHIFTNNQQYHPFVCGGTNKSRLDPDNLFESCICEPGKVKVNDEFRGNIPICLEKNILTLFPNFSLK